MNDIFNTQRFAGIRIVESESLAPVPKFQVSAEFERLQSPELVASTNAWAREFFGVEHRAFLIADTMLVNPNIGGELRAALVRIKEATDRAEEDAIEFAFAALAGNLVEDPLKG